MIKVVLIDLDDTLFMTEEACYYMENEVLEAMGRLPMSRETHQANWGKPLFEAILERSPGLNLNEFRKLYKPINARYVEEGKLDTLTSQNLEALDRLASMGKQLMILTSREHDELAHLLTNTHILTDRIEFFYYKNNLKYHKPDPRVFEHIKQDHGWKPEECVYVGDSITDAVAANGAGLHFIASLESGLRSKEDFEDFQVNGFITTFPDVVAAVQSLDR